ncbi:hypothetical protein M408DRAFT_18754 [Serendipita vermifera MAFF 305830]|uniref:Uncharacterized protein n=1 Tax=Serendipita vermifera MAFF 305830 TaxID=933852 RepID=A0A0C3BA85_SERVB|nr:hypothetical protein M408DRAFT_18754 [Serendipita vermifera MAFF 305830]
MSNPLLFVTTILLSIGNVAATGLSKLCSSDHNGTTLCSQAGPNVTFIVGTCVPIAVLGCIIAWGIWHRVRKRARARAAAAVTPPTAVAEASSPLQPNPEVTHDAPPAEISETQQSMIGPAMREMPTPQPYAGPSNPLASNYAPPTAPPPV